MKYIKLIIVALLILIVFLAIFQNLDAGQPGMQVKMH